MRPQHLTHEELETLKKKHKELFIDDHIDLALEELFDIDYPSQKDTRNRQDIERYSQQITEGKPEEWGEWVYFPWLNQVVHFPPKKALRTLRTSRNRNLITTEEQKTLYGATLLIIGMSVGSNIVEALVSQGIGNKLILIDMDIIEPSNLNRIRSAYHQVGLHKVDAISRKVWEIDPYIEIVGYHDGLNEKNLGEILEQHQVNVIIDEMDELRMKILLREAAKERHLPVVMAADDGDNALLDIERYDLESELELFSGRIPADILEKIKSQSIPRPQLGMMIGKYFVGAQNIPLRMYESLGEVGKSLPSWPQLGGAAALSGVSIAYIIKKILLGHKLKTGRILISLDEKLDLEHLEPDYQAQLSKFQTMLEGQNL
jgi:molybdopterin/thiamine biosynthesis adenylyltransferase